MRFVIGTIFAIVGGALLYTFETTRGAGMILLIVAAIWVASSWWAFPLAFESRSKHKRKMTSLFILRESGPMEGPKLVDYNSVSLTAALMHLQNGDVMQRVIVSDGERVLVLEADGSWQAGGVDRASIATAVEEPDDLL